MLPMKKFLLSCTLFLFVACIPTAPELEPAAASLPNPAGQDMVLEATPTPALSPAETLTATPALLPAATSTPDYTRTPYPSSTPPPTHTPDPSSTSTPIPTPTAEPAYFCQIQNDIPAAECLALAALYQTTNGPGWLVPDWYTAVNWFQTTPCQWSGIQCEESHVVEIDLMYYNLAGPIPAEIGNLPALKVLALHGNQLTGSIPTTIGNLTLVEEIYLGANQLTGSIPAEFGNLSQLKTLVLWYNQLTGSLPDIVSRMPNLSHVSVSYNQLTGEIPAAYFRLTDFGYEGNFFENAPPYPTPTAYHTPTPTPSSWLDCSAVTEIPQTECETLIQLYNQAGGFYWYNNSRWLSDTTPCLWFGLTCENGRVVSLDLANNNLTGSIPAEIGNLTALRYLGLNVNNLSGEIPTTIGNLTNLDYLYLSVNQLSGPIPAEIGNITTLRAIWLADNQLTGPIPASLGNLPLLFQLLLTDNNLSGPLPAELGNATNLFELWFNNNPELSGPMPTSFVNLPLVTLFYENTAVCTPNTPEFQTWLASIGGVNSNGQTCP